MAATISDDMSRVEAGASFLRDITNPHTINMYLVRERNKTLLATKPSRVHCCRATYPRESYHQPGQPFNLTVGFARRKLIYLDDAEDLHDLFVPPGNQLEKLKGDRKGQYSIRINDQWRICFDWTNKRAENVEIDDYH